MKKNKKSKKLELDIHVQKNRKRASMGSGAYEPALKKARTFSVTPISVDVNGFGNGNGAAGVQPDQANGDLECRRFGTPEGCPYGTKCRFKHGPAGTVHTTSLMQFACRRHLLRNLWHCEYKLFYGLNSYVGRCHILEYKVVPLGKIRSYCTLLMTNECSERQEPLFGIEQGFQVLRSRKRNRTASYYHHIISIS